MNKRIAKKILTRFIESEKTNVYLYNKASDYLTKLNYRRYYKTHNSSINNNENIDKSQNYEKVN